MTTLELITDLELDLDEFKNRLIGLEDRVTDIELQAIKMLEMLDRILTIVTAQVHRSLDEKA